MAEKTRKIKDRNQSYTETLYFEVKQTAKYCKMLGLQLFSKVNSPISPEELIILDVVSKNPDICQRDLAKNILKDRANTGRLLESLEKKELIKRVVDVKNNRLVKKIVITDSGEELLEDTMETMYPIFEEISKSFTEEEVIQTKHLLKKMRDTFKNIVELRI